MRGRNSSIRKVLLINPPFLRLQGSSFYFAPLGLCYLAAVLEQANYDVAVYNADFDVVGGGVASRTKRSSAYVYHLNMLANLEDPLWREIEKVIRDFGPDLVGIGAMTPKYSSALNVARLVKQIDPAIITVLGGPHPTALPAACLKGKKEVDYVVRGDGDITFLELIKHLDKGQTEIQSIAGISYKQDQEVLHAPGRQLIADLDSIPKPAKHLLLNRSKYPATGLGPIFTSRGCPYRCIFCASYQTWGRKVRYRSPRCVVNEIKECQRDFGVYRFRFEDDSFSIKRSHAEAICDLLLEDRVDINFWCEARADSLDELLVRKMKAAGCVAVSIGVESGDNEVLRLIRKGITLDDVRTAVELLKKHEIECHTFFMMGFPFETRAQIQKTIDFMREIDPDHAEIAIATPLPGTELFKTALAEGIVSQNPEWDRFFYGGLERLPNMSMQLDELDNVIEEVQRIFIHHNLSKRKRYLLKPGYLYRRVLKEKFWRKPRILLSYLKELFGRL